MSPVLAVELLFFAIFGQTTHEQFKVETMQPDWTRILFKLAFGIYMLVSVVVLINLLIAMMSDTYQRIQAQSDIEWKYGLSKLVRNMHRTSTAPSPLNLFTTWLSYLFKLCERRAASRQRPSLVRMMGLRRADAALSARSRMGAKWLSKAKKSQIGHKDSVALSVVHLSPLGSRLSFGNAAGSAVRIDDVVDWVAVGRKYRDLYGQKFERTGDQTDRTEETDSSQTLNDAVSASTTTPLSVSMPVPVPPMSMSMSMPMPVPVPVPAIASEIRASFPSDAPRRLH